MKKKLALKLILLGFLCVVFACGVSMLIDPYNVFHWSRARDNGVEPNKNYVKTQYVLHHPEQYDTFIFGNSRVGSIDASKIGDTCYNMYYSEGLPAEHYENLKAFVAAGVDVKTVYLGIDDVTCFVDPAIHDDQLIRRPFRAQEPEIAFLADYLDPSVALQSLEAMAAYTGEEPGFRERLYSTGNYYLDTDLTAESLEQEEWPNYFAWYGEGAIEDIRELKNYCDTNEIELIVFVNPEYERRFDEAIEQGYLDFLKELAGITDYYCFCGYNDITTDMANFHDISHYRQSVGDLMIQIMKGENNGETLQSLQAQGFGRYVTAANAEEVIENLKGME
ncbi:MAG: hypothetical protein ACI4C4_01790 [Lachnospiraceae bacterium]